MDWKRSLALLLVVLGACAAPSGVARDKKCYDACIGTGGVCLDYNNSDGTPPQPVIIEDGEVTYNPDYPGAQCCPPQGKEKIEDELVACAALQGHTVADIANYQPVPKGGMMMSGGCKSNMDCKATPATSVCNTDTGACVKAGFDCRVGTDKCTGTQMCDPADGMCKNPPQENKCTESKPCEQGKVCVAGMPNLCLDGHCSGVNGKDVFGRPAGALNNPYCGNGGKGDVSGACKVGTCKEGQRLGVSSELDLSDCAPGTNGRKWHANDIGVPAEVDPQATYCLKGN